ncbi:hypothetical protein GDO78_016745 [Eleutherodactylus coqui]|uniref:Uncharacterized protein n=1 Tax=Eleutherodactylus coqui TaxID=57060 RepID=A0A8J6B6C2_ELECQ|nr:hypothetical protein GDO78_016745 [Eleutherodactylus coqui]
MIVYVDTPDSQGKENKMLSPALRSKTSSEKVYAVPAAWDESGLCSIFPHSDDRSQRLGVTFTMEEYRTEAVFPSCCRDCIDVSLIVYGLSELQIVAPV